MKTLLLLSLLLASPALARIGETREQCEARYGKPVKIEEEKQVVHYEKAGFKIRCGFFEGKCEDITFNHVDLDEQLKPSPIADAEVTALMESNSSGRPWTLEMKDKEGFEAWTCGDLVASLNRRPVRYLMINTKAFDERRRAKYAAKK